jgi:flagellin-like hook-associated protein FlgL
MIIQNNLRANNVLKQLNISGGRGAKHAGRLASGLRINNASDDAAGLAISEKMRGQIRGLAQNYKNTQDGISLIQTADGAMSQIHDMLNRMRELSVQALNEITLTYEDKRAIQDEIDQLAQEINRIANFTEFNTMKILSGGEYRMKVVEGTDVPTVSNVVTSTASTNFTDLFAQMLPNDSTPTTVQVQVFGETVDFTLQKEADGTVTITAANESTVLGSTNIGGGVTTLWERAYGGGGGDGAMSVINLPQGGFLIAGSTNSGGTNGPGGDVSGYTPGASHGGESDGWTITVDASGNLVSGQTYHPGGGYHDTINKAINTSDGGYLLIGRAGMQSNGTWAAKVGGAGPTLQVSRPTGGGFEAKDAVQIGNNYYILSFNTATNNNRAIITAVGNNGTVLSIWSYFYQSAGAGVLEPGALCASPAGDLLYINEFDDTINVIDPATGGRTVHSLGGILNQLGAPIGSFSKMSALSNGNYLITGDNWLAEVSIGQTGPQLVRSLPLSFTNATTTVNRIVQDQGQILLVGEQTAGGATVGWIAKVDMNNFGFNWQDTYGTDNSSAYDVVIAPSGDYLVVGNTNSNDPQRTGANSTGTDEDFWVVALGENAGTQTIAGIDDVPMSLQNIVDGNVTISFTATVVTFDPNEVIPGVQTGELEQIHIEAVRTEYEYVYGAPTYATDRRDRGLYIQTGPNTGQNVIIPLPDMHMATLGFPAGYPDILSVDNANATLDYVDRAGSVVSGKRALLGALQNRFEHTMNNVAIAAENQTAAESRIRDADMAKEVAELTKNTVLQQAGMFMLTQANAHPQAVLRLLN